MTIGTKTNNNKIISAQILKTEYVNEYWEDKHLNNGQSEGANFKSNFHPSTYFIYVNINDKVVPISFLTELSSKKDGYEKMNLPFLFVLCYHKIFDLLLIFGTIW